MGDLQTNIKGQKIIESLNNGLEVPQLKKDLAELSLQTTADINALDNKLYGNEGLPIDLNLYEALKGYIYNGLYRGITSSGHAYKIVDVIAGRNVKIAANSNFSAEIAFLKSYNTPTSNDTYAADFCAGTELINIKADKEIDITIHQGCKYLYIRTLASSNNTCPSSIEYIAKEGDIEKLQKDIKSVQEQIKDVPTEHEIEEIVNPIHKLANENKENIEKLNTRLYGEEQQLPDIDIASAEQYKGYINDSTNLFRGLTSELYAYKVIEVKADALIKIVGNETYSCKIAFLKSYERPTINDSYSADYCDGTSIYVISVGANVEITVPSDCIYLYVQVLASNKVNSPVSVEYVEETSSGGDIARLDNKINNVEKLVNEKADKQENNSIDENFPINPQILDTDSITIKSWNVNEDGAEVVDGVRGEDFNTTSRVTFNEACNINIENWDAFEVVFKVAKTIDSDMVVKLQNGATNIFNKSIRVYINKCPYNNQLYRYRFALKDIDNYDSISHIVNNVQVIFLTNNIENTCTMYGIKFVKIRPCIFLSFDGSWGGVVNLALPIMSRHSIRGITYTEVQYMTGEKNDGRHMTPEQVRILDINGWDVSNHSWHHKRWSPENPENTPEMCEEDMKFSRDWLLQNGFARGANFYAAPHGVTNQDMSVIFDNYMKYYRAGGSANYDGYVFPCGLWLTANGRCNIIPYTTYGGADCFAEPILERINRGIAKGKSININFHDIVADKADGETYNDEQFPIGEFTKLIEALAALRDEGKCYVLPNSDVWYGCRGAEIYDNISGHAEMIGMDGKVISLDANKIE